MLAEISGGLASLKAAKDIVQTLNAVHTEAAVGGVKVELQGLMLDAQQALFAAQEAQSHDAERIRGLEAEVVRLKDWSAEKERYVLADAGQGALAFRIKAGMATGDAPHWLCAQCFEEGHKAYLQPEKHQVGRTSHLVCHRCGSDLVIAGMRFGDSPTLGPGRPHR